MKRVTEPMSEEEQRQRSRRRFEEEQPGRSVRQGLPEPDPSGVAAEMASLISALGGTCNAGEKSGQPSSLEAYNEVHVPGARVRTWTTGAAGTAEYV